MNYFVFASLVTLQLQSGDLDRALAVFKAEFKRKYGQEREPAVIGIANHRRNQEIIGEARRRGFTVTHEPKGMLAFEIWMYPEIQNLNGLKEGVQGQEEAEAPGISSALRQIEGRVI